MLWITLLDIALGDLASARARAFARDRALGELGSDLAHALGSARDSMSFAARNSTSCCAD